MPAKVKATFEVTGMERIQGTVAGKHGTLVVLHDGTFEDGVAGAELRVVSGTDIS